MHEIDQTLSRMRKRGTRFFTTRDVFHYLRVVFPDVSVTYAALRHALYRHDDVAVHRTTQGRTEWRLL